MRVESDGVVGARGVLVEDRPNRTAGCSRVAGCAPVAAVRHCRFRQVVPISAFRRLSRWAIGEAGRAEGDWSAVWLGLDQLAGDLA